MSANRYAYNYAEIELDTGRCIGAQDTTNYILRRDYVLIPEAKIAYLNKYYHPIPETVTSFDDFQGKWYLDAEFQNEATEMNG